jgi:peptide/nickel transport system substrate-binding protein
MRRLITLLLLIAFVVPVMASRPAVAQAEKLLVIGTAENSTSLDPARGFEQTTGIVHKAVYDTLVTFPADNVDKIMPHLAESWKASDDGKTYTFTLRKDAVFASGNPVTADDVVFSFNRTKNVKGNPSFLAESIEKVSATDKQTVVIALNRPDPAILAKLVYSSFGVTEAAVVKAQGGTDAVDADKTDQAEKWLNQNSAGTGPYILTKWDQHNEIVLVKNAKYWGTTPAFDRIILRDIPQAAAQKAALEVGDVDIATDLSADQLASIKSNADLKVFEGISPIVFFLLFNQDKTIGGPVSDAKVQKAIRLALDYEGILKLAGGSAAQPASVIPVGFAGALGSDKALKRNLDAAKKLMAEAGQDKGFSIDLEYWDATYQGINIGTLAQKVQADLKELSITVNLKPGELQQTLGNYRDGKEGFGLWFWGPDYIDALDYVEFLPEGVVGKRVKWLDANASDDIKKLRDTVKVEPDVAKRGEIFAQIQTYMQESGPFAPLVQPGNQIGYRANLKGFAYSFQWLLDPATFSK